MSNRYMRRCYILWVPTALSIKSTGYHSKLPPEPPKLGRLLLLNAGAGREKLGKQAWVQEHKVMSF